ncbi:hypothetical protein WR25_07951 [Diploscapter pachys]|uniref:Uncharacterized protein n=1 Tax=Diploscapter pachys TaxID=2018661 RepID=A0A2A2KKH3_9BILA|nr:hypothetical protein WR25_07951 [Diploscapter pachys]
MVAPTQGLEYRPTLYLWLIVLFGVFPLIYLMGQVTFCIIAVVFRILRGLFRFLYYDDDEEERALRLAKAKLERKRRRHQQRVREALLAVAGKNGSVRSENHSIANGNRVTKIDVNHEPKPSTSHTHNRHRHHNEDPRHTAANLTPPTTADMPSDVSDSLASEYDEEIAKIVGNGVQERAKFVTDKVQNLG